MVESSRKGATTRPVNLAQISNDLVEALIGMDVVIDCMTLSQTRKEIVHIDESSKVNVWRCVSSFGGPVCPPRGVRILRESS